jgi:hypothetical protein
MDGMGTHEEAGVGGVVGVYEQGFNFDDDTRL